MILDHSPQRHNYIAAGSQTFDYIPFYVTVGDVTLTVPITGFYYTTYTTTLDVFWHGFGDIHAPKGTPEPFPEKYSEWYERPKPSLQSRLAQQEAERREYLEQVRAEAREKTLQDLAIRNEITARMEAERREFEARQKKRQTALMNLEKAKAVQEAERQRQAEINAQRAKNLKKARKALAKKRGKK